VYLEMIPATSLAAIPVTIDARAEGRGSRLRAGFRRMLRIGSLLGLSSLLLLLRCAAQEPGQTAQPSTVDRTLTSLHGVVRNAATGEGLPRALVRVEGDANTGALTDGEGRFEISNIPVGPQTVEVAKPGFLDRSAGGGTADFEGAATLTHNVMVAAEMPDVVFTLAPAGIIHGQVELSTGEPAGGITVQLVTRTIEDGRVVWQAGRTAKTNSDGAFRFAGLANGEYALYSEPAMANDLDAAPDLGGAGERRGYAIDYYPDAREQAGAEKIRVASGAEVQANLTLTLETFHTVTALVSSPQAARQGLSYSAEVMDGAGNQLPYPVQYDQKSHTVKAQLPDGTYALLVSAEPGTGRPPGLAGDADPGTMIGTVDFSVAGQVVPNLRVSLSAQHPSPVLVTVNRSTDGTGANQTGGIAVTLTPSGGWSEDSLVSIYARGSAPSTLPAVNTPPGSYWVTASVAQKGLCEASFTAGGANLAREPVIVGPSGSTAHMELTLRDDCATLQLSLPESLASIAAGEEQFYTVFVVPDFDLTANVQPLTLRPSSGGTATVAGLTPGNYHVYTFAGAAQLAYRDPAALAALPNQGQAITLAAGATGSLVVEVPQP
jgi:hypothetical protein